MTDVFSIYSAGEVADYLTILRIKQEKGIDNQSTKIYTINELLQEECPKGRLIDLCFAMVRLEEINKLMWDLEDQIRSSDISDAARGIQVLENRRANSRRVEIKNQINDIFKHSPERKDYAGFDKA